MFADRFFRHFRNGIRLGFRIYKSVALFTVQQFVQLIGIEPQHREIEIGVLEVFEFHRQEIVIPFGDLAGLVVGNPVGLHLFRDQVICHDHRDFGQSQLLGGLQAGMPDDDDHILVHDDGLLPPEFLDGPGDRIDRAIVDTRVLLIRTDVRDFHVYDVHEFLSGWLCIP